MIRNPRSPDVVPHWHFLRAPIYHSVSREVKVAAES